MMKVYVVNVKTESCDTYIWVYSYEPTDEEVIKRLMDIEGFDYDDPENGYQWFVDTTSVYIGETDIIDRGNGRWYYITYWSNLDECYGEDTIWADSSESAKSIFFESDFSRHCEIVSVEIE